ncbi:5'-hydroxyaverantin dehydrogenase [Cyphellophora attinorum]|uniref:5'-hydroxyaverantin dehydrogenase n=1 Tax=Cyphellophora attinorum TaxID=1664694 RepID=A0A0N0NHC9_9EURO|nr:5'-hydroxyaverantin dehydrogenase [Phialophora attinorum]KPI34418.1 5'-hydroxyaverantin dehydrogenase [Phialophora attinorum]
MPEGYAPARQFDGSIPVDLSQCQGKSVIVTGGAQGIGEAYVRAFASAGAFVTFCDINVETGRALEAELGSQGICFVKADTRSWEEQTELYEAAVSKSPHKSVDIVIANAGIGRGSGDPMMALEDPKSKPTKPSMHIIDINLIGVMYSLKLAIHYFRRSPVAEDRDRCFIFGGSIAGYVDNLSSWEYSTSKFGLRGLMRTVRRQSHHQHIRVAYIAPSYIRTVIQSAAVYEAIRAKGIEFATTEGCVNAAMRICCDRSINGLALAIVPESVAKEGFIHLDMDDEKDTDSFVAKFQEAVINLRGDNWN